MVSKYKFFSIDSKILILFYHNNNAIQNNETIRFKYFKNKIED